MWMMDYSRLKFIQLFGCLGLISCTRGKKDRPIAYNEAYYLSEEERAKHEKKALAGNGRSAVKLADHEATWGDPKKTVYWYKFAYDLGYKKERTKVQMESFARGEPELEEYLQSLKEKD